MFECGRRRVSSTATVLSGRRVDELGIEEIELAQRVQQCFGRAGLVIIQSKVVQYIGTHQVIRLARRYTFGNHCAVIVVVMVFIGRLGREWILVVCRGFDLTVTDPRAISRMCRGSLKRTQHKFWNQFPTACADGGSPE